MPRKRNPNSRSAVCYFIKYHDCPLQVYIFSDDQTNLYISQMSVGQLIHRTVHHVGHYTSSTPEGLKLKAEGYDCKVIRYPKEFVIVHVMAAASYWLNEASNDNQLARCICSGKTIERLVKDINQQVVKSQFTPHQTNLIISPVPISC